MKKYFEYVEQGIYGFRPLYTGLVSNMKYQEQLVRKLFVSFRPLYTGLVSNPVPWNPRRYWAENAVCG